MEIEAKFRVAAADLAIAAALRHLGPYTLTPVASPERQLNTYYDTADRRLAAARYGLRVRRVGPVIKITLKGPAEVTPDGVQRRAEHEFPGDDPHPAAWPPGVARELGLALTGGAPLAATVAVATERHLLYAARDGATVAEIALDRGVLHAAGRERPFAEIEIELLADGRPGDIAALATALRHHVRLQPEPRSKLQRALDLLNEATGA